MTHVAAQRGYKELTQVLINHWNEFPIESPFQPYSVKVLRKLLDLIVEQQEAAMLMSESDAEFRALVAEIGVPFSHLCDAMDRNYGAAISLQDLILICGHPLVLCRDASGNTPLHYAAEGGYLSLCQLLIENGAQINAQNKLGETPYVPLSSPSI